MKLNINKLKLSKWKISRPAIIAAIAYAVLALIILLPFDISEAIPDENVKKEYNIKYRLWILLVLLIPIGLSVYSIDCMVVGNCIIWSWVQAIIIALWVILFTVVTLNK